MFLKIKIALMKIFAYGKIVDDCKIPGLVSLY
jgi:hypothetical protein